MLDGWHGAGGTIRAKNANKKTVAPSVGGWSCLAAGSRADLLCD